MRKALIFGVSVVAAATAFLLFSPNRSPKVDRGSSEVQASSQEGDRASNTEGYEERLRSALASLSEAESPEELIAILKKLLAEDEALAIAAFAELDEESAAFSDPWTITSFFRTYLSDRYKALDGLERIAEWREKKPGYFKQAAVDLLSDHSSKDDPASVIEFLNAPENSNFASLIHQDAGYELARTNPEKLLGIIDQLSEPTAQESFREGIFSRWMVDDIGAVAAHLDGIELDASFDNILERFALRSENDFNSDFLEWAALIKDPELRANTLVDLGKRWVQEPSFQEDYQNWKNSLSDEDHGVITELERYESEYALRRQIKDDFREISEQAKNASIADDDISYNQSIEQLASLIERTTEQLQNNPDNIVLRQELRTIHQRLDEDYHLSGGLPAPLQQAIDRYNSTTERLSEN